jgi:four helix bundle protein
MQLVLKELRESGYWLKLIERTTSIPKRELQPLKNEAEELVKIFVRSVITAEARRG